MCPWVQPRVSPVASCRVMAARGRHADRVPGAGCARWCTRGDRGCMVSAGGAHHTGWDECIYGLFYKARLGQGRCQSGARTVPERVPEQCPDSAITAPPHPTPDTRHHPMPATHHPTSTRGISVLSADRSGYCSCYIRSLA